MNDPRFNFFNLPDKARVLLVSNIPSDLAKTRELFNIFSIYGDVYRVKILRKKLDTALIEFSTATLAMIARNHLDQAEICGKKLVVSFARFDRVRLPSECGMPDDEYTEDFSSPEHVKLHRFSTKDLMTKGLKRISKPGTLVHVSNVPAHTSGNEVKMFFERAGYKIKDILSLEIVKKKPDGRIMCYMEMLNVDDTVMAVAKMSGEMKENDKRGKEGVGIRMAFSPSTIEEEKKRASEGVMMNIVPNDRK